MTLLPFLSIECELNTEFTLSCPPPTRPTSWCGKATQLILEESKESLLSAESYCLWLNYSSKNAKELPLDHQIKPLRLAYS